MLGRRELSEAQVRQRLGRKGHDAGHIEEAVDRLKREHAIDDARVAWAIARTETGLKHRGMLRVRQQIARAGIDPVKVKAAVDAVFDGIDTAALLDAALAKRLRHGRGIADEREFARLYRYLLAQGFESGRVLEVLAGRRCRA